MLTAVARFERIAKAWSTKAFEEEDSKSKHGGRSVSSMRKQTLDEDFNVFKSIINCTISPLLRLVFSTSSDIETNSQPILSSFPLCFLIHCRKLNMSSYNFEATITNQLNVPLTPISP